MSVQTPLTSIKAAKIDKTPQGLEGWSRLEGRGYPEMKKAGPKTRLSTE